MTPLRDIEAQVSECVGAVDLDVAFSPVLPKPGDKQPIEVERDDGAFVLVWRNALTGAAYREPVETGALRLMRARYLVTRGETFMAFHTLSAREQREAARTLGLGMIPADGSPLARLATLESAVTRERDEAATRLREAKEHAAEVTAWVTKQRARLAKGRE